MLKKILILTTFFLLSCSAYSMPEEAKAYLANQCHEVSQNIEALSVDQTNSCSSIIQESAKLVDRSGQFILKEYWFNARTDLHRSYRLLTDTTKMNCNSATEISIAQKNIDAILEQLYGLE
ncbi:hypothetical protein OQJ19_09280 [Fluoribacter gormanii]|uniref:Lipoprotein n=1 Tax=Fluoribacter gormanii TaxID=464 RepID=A0A377GMJ8_9GAMM|nr:hypothetical protein [Fluoribacter gormanii]KTD05110.1 hypothetical protein Lgor_0741 [Fluoribacter gormanii]MCW8470841.1 hypothetical protein [Fluoribacter gormanii]SIQ99409.1 hypothetical protein SAMN05421777_10563 [Fluoribacter gormanii]STO26036.1 Uncharacterised protein [Fluoribacter gormanii]